MRAVPLHIAQLLAGALRAGIEGEDSAPDIFITFQESRADLGAIAIGKQVALADYFKSTRSPVSTFLYGARSPISLVPLIALTRRLGAS